MSNETNDAREVSVSKKIVKKRQHSPTKDFRTVGNREAKGTSHQKKSQFHKVFWEGADARWGAGIGQLVKKYPSGGQPTSPKETVVRMRGNPGAE